MRNHRLSKSIADNLLGRRKVQQWEECYRAKICSEVYFAALNNDAIAMAHKLKARV